MDKILRVLILEDRASDADLMQFELQEGGISFTSKCVKAAKEYVQALHEFLPDLILSDYDLPQYSGELALVEAKRLCPEVPFILVTGAFDTEEEPIRRILTRGASGYVFKNRLDRLAATVKKAFGSNGGS